MNIGKALIVDDSKVVVFKLKRMLEARGIGVDTASSGLEALEFLKTHAPDVIFMDCMMPDMDGYQATSAIKADARTSAIPVVMCTGHDTPEEQQRAREHGAIDYMVKPFDDSLLDAVLARLRDPAALITAPSAVPIAAPAPVTAPAARLAPAPAATQDPAVEAARVAERVARELTEKLLRESSATLSATFERIARDAAQDAATRAARDAVQTAIDGVEATRRADAAAADHRLRDLLASAQSAAEQAARQSVDAARAAMEQSLRDSLQSARSEIADSARAAAQDAARPAAESAARAMAEQQMRLAHDALRGEHAELRADIERSLANAIAEAKQLASDLAQQAVGTAEARGAEQAQALRNEMNRLATDRAQDTLDILRQVAAAADLRNIAQQETALADVERLVADQTAQATHDLLQQVSRAAEERHADDSAEMRADIERLLDGQVEQMGRDMVRRAVDAAAAHSTEHIAAARADIEGALDARVLQIMRDVERQLSASHRPSATEPEYATISPAPATDLGRAPADTGQPGPAADADLTPTQTPRPNPAESFAEPHIAGSEPSSDRAASRWLLPWLAGLTLVVVYLVVKSF